MALKNLFNPNNINNASFNIYANKINAQNLDVENIDINNATLENLEVTNSTILNGNVDIKGSIFPDSNTTAGWVLTNVDGAGNLQWAPDGSSGSGDVSFVDAPPTQINEVCLYGSTDGQGIKKSNILSSNLFLADGSIPMTNNMNLGVNDILNVDNIEANGDIRTVTNIRGQNFTSYGDLTTKIQIDNNNIDINLLNNNIIKINNSNQVNFERATTTGSGVFFNGLNGSYRLPTVHTGIIGGVLTDSAGDGNLTFALPPSGNSTSGTYTPVIYVSSGAVTIIRDALYTRIGNIINVSGFCVITLPVLGETTFTMYISPAPLTNNNNSNLNAMLNGGWNPATKNIFCYDLQFSGGNFNLQLRSFDNTPMLGGSCSCQYNINYVSTI